MKIKRLDAFEMNFEECSVSQKYKLNTKGVGEKRIYVGHDEKLLDEFFDLDKIDSFIILKKDLQKYLIDARDEYLDPVQDYKQNITQFYDDNIEFVDAIKDDTIILHFTKKYDSQHRYYLNFKNDGYSAKNWDYVRDIALPRVTKLNFVKIRDISTKKLYIYIKPTFYIDNKITIENDIKQEKPFNKAKSDIIPRKKQAQYRNKLLEIMPSCIITSVSDDRILDACHIKPFRNCENDEERYDVHNGIIMTPTYHRLFDMGFFTFHNDGRIVLSPFLSNMNKKRLSLSDGAQFRIQKGSSKYLEYHRDVIFNQIPDLVI